MALVLGLCLLPFSPAQSQGSKKVWKIQTSLATTTCEDLGSNSFPFSQLPHGNGGACKVVDRSLPEGDCTVDLKQCLRPELSNLIGKTLPVPGANCFSTALYASKNYPGLRYVSETEFLAIVESPFCTQKQNLEPGDFGVFQNPDHEIIHAYYYLGSGLVFEKQKYDLSQETIYPILLNSFAHTLYKWEAPIECRRYGGTSEDCFNRHYFMNCDLSKVHYGLPRSMDLLWQDIQKDVETWIHGVIPLPNKKSLRLQQLNGLRLHLGKVSLPPYQRRILMEQLNSLETQINQVP